MTKITNETILETRQWYHDNAMGCIAEVKSGEVKVNDPEKYFEDCNRRAKEYLDGKWDHTLAFIQRAHYIQTGECHAILP